MYCTTCPTQCPCLSSGHTPSLHPCHAIQLGKLHNHADPAAETPGAHLWGSSAPPLTLTHSLSRQLLCSPHSASNPDSKPLQVLPSPSPSPQLLDDKFPVSSRQAACVIGKLLCMGHRASSPTSSSPASCPALGEILASLTSSRTRTKPHPSVHLCLRACMHPSVPPSIRVSVHQFIDPSVNPRSMHSSPTSFFLLTHPLSPVFKTPSS